MKENWEIHWKDYYKILQIHPSAESEVVKAAFNKLAHKYHPDKNKEPTANEIMTDLIEAFEIISNPEKRARYHNSYIQRPIRPSGSSNVPYPYPTKPQNDPSKPKPKPQTTTNSSSEDTQSEMCPVCREITDMHISFIDKIPTYARCKKCNHLFNLPQSPHNSGVDEMSKAEIARRMKEFLRNNKKRFK